MWFSFTYLFRFNAYFLFFPIGWLTAARSHVQKQFSLFFSAVFRRRRKGGARYKYHRLELSAVSVSSKESLVSFFFVILLVQPGTSHALGTSMYFIIAVFFFLFFPFFFRYTGRAEDREPVDPSLGSPLPSSMLERNWTTKSVLPSLFRDAGDV